MLESFSDKFEYKKLTEEEQQKRGILGRLVGVMADTKNPTRNGRKYSKELWEKVFNDPIMEEKIKNKVVFGELGHPSDRTETDISKAAIVLSEKPKLKRDGKLYGVFDILDTPNGRILKTLCDYGTTIGVSSRGEGDIIEDYNGDEAVDPDTYSCECWDAVLLPAVKEARMNYVTESLNTRDLKTRLSEEIDKANDGDKEIMKETLNKLDINLNEEKINEEEANYVATDSNSGCRIYKVGDNYTTTYLGKTITSDNLERLLAAIRTYEDKHVNHFHNLPEDLKSYHVIDKEDKDLLNTFDTEEEAKNWINDHRWVEGEDVIITTNKDDINWDLTEQFYINSTKLDDVRTKLKMKVDSANLRDDLLAIADEDTLQKLVRKYISKEDRKGLGVEILTPDEKEELGLEESIPAQLYTKVIKAINDGIESDEDTEEIRKYLQDIIGYCRTVADDFGVTVESLNEKLVEPSKEDLKPIEAKFDELGLEIEGQGPTLFGNKHYQLRKELDHDVTKDDLSKIFKELCNLDSRDMPTTCNVGIHKDGNNIISASVDVMKKHIADEALVEEEKEVVDNQSLLTDLTEALKDKSDLEASVADVQNKLAVSDAKVESLEEELNKYKDLSAKLSLKAKESKKKITELQESLDGKDKTIKQLKESRVKFATKTKSLNESVSNKDNEVQKLNESLAKKDDEVKKLTEDLEEALANSTIQEKQHKDEVSKLNNLAEAYKKVANKTMKRYIESKATMYGLSFNDIRNRLPDSYTADDVDKICESMRSYSLNSMRLPVKTSKIKFTESKNDHLRITSPEDEVDDDLLNLANSI